MYTIENKKIVLAVFKLIFQGNWIGNAICSYEYDTPRDGFKNLLKIDLDITYQQIRTKTQIDKSFELEIERFEDSSQAFDLINSYLKLKFLGIDIILVKAIFEFNFTTKEDNKIRLTLIGPDKIPFEITNQKNGRYLSLLDINEKDAISYASENLI